MSGRVITVTSGKGGVGKTTTTANLAMALASLEKRIIAIDADIGLRNLDLVMGLENRIVYDLVDVVEGRCTLRQAMVKHKGYPYLYLIPASQTRDKTAITPQNMRAVAMELKDSYDFILVDSPAGIEWGFKNAIAPADEVLIVTNPDVSAVRDADRIIGLIETHDVPIPVRLVINRLKSGMVRKGEMLSVDDIIGLLSIRLVGVIPEDENVLRSSNQGVAVAGPAGQAFLNLARRLDGEQVPFQSLEITSLMDRFRRLFNNR
ncbi:MAG: septum site-determining protein MinD [Chloroflexi bacterium]|nr:septum site-determining protein MinD [Chloroflexota bacterium]